MDVKRLLAQQRHLDAQQVRKAEAEARRLMARRLMAQRQRARILAIRVVLRTVALDHPVTLRQTQRD